MKMKRILAVLMALCLALALAACGGNQGGNAGGEQGGNQGGVIGQGGNGETQQTTEATVSGIVYTVKVVDEGGNPIAGAFVQMCQGETCMPMQTAADGVATYKVSEEADFEVKFVMMPAGYELPTEESVFHFADGSKDMTITLKSVA